MLRSLWDHRRGGRTITISERERLRTARKVIQLRHATATRERLRAALQIALYK